MNSKQKRERQVQYLMNSLDNAEKWDLIMQEQTQLRADLALALASDNNYNTRHILALYCLNTDILSALLQDDHSVVIKAAVESLHLLSIVDDDARELLKTYLSQKP